MRLGPLRKDIDLFHTGVCLQERVLLELEMIIDRDSRLDAVRKASGRNHLVKNEIQTLIRGFL